MIHKTTVVIAEQNYLIRRGLVATLHEIANVEIVTQIDDTKQFAQSIGHKLPEILILGAGFSPLFFGSAMAELSAKSNSTVLVGLCESADNLGEFQDHFDCILERNNTKAIIQDKLIAFFEKDANSENELTAREKDIVRSIALGLTNKEIGDTLFISPHTVITHRKNITRKLGIKSVSGLTVFAILNNLISVDEVNE